MNNGVAVTILIAVGWTIWRVIKWAQPLAERVVGSHLELIDELKRQSPKITEAISKGTEATQEIKTVNQQIHAELQSQTQEIRRESDVLDARNEKFDQIINSQESIKATIKKLLPPEG